MGEAYELCKAFRVHGRVQGVGFRWWVQRYGRSLGLRGTVRNCSDGTVEVTLAGALADVEEMIRRLKSGPPGSEVHRLEELDPPEAFPGEFQIVF